MLLACPLAFEALTLLCLSKANTDGNHQMVTEGVCEGIHEAPQVPIKHIGYWGRTDLVWHTHEGTNLVMKYW